MTANVQWPNGARAVSHVVGRVSAVVPNGDPTADALATAFTIAAWV